MALSSFGFSFSLSSDENDIISRCVAPTIDHYVVQGNVKQRMKRLKAKTA